MKSTETMGQESNYDEPAQMAVAVPEKSAVMAPPGSSTVAVSLGDTNSSLPMWQQEKQGAKCCGCCCDYRRAVIVLAIITICIDIGYILLALIAASTPTTRVDADDDAVLAVYEDSATYQAIFSGVSLFCSICALLGANKFNIPLVAINTLWYVANFIAGTIISLNTINEMNEIATTDVTYTAVPSIILGAVVAMLFMYPHIGFMYEVKNGIMSFETYPREEYSCCCAPGGRRV